MTATDNIDLTEELGWLLSTVEAACLLVEMAEGDPDQAARLATNAHAVLRLAVGRLHDLAEGVEAHPPESPRAKRRR